MEHVLSVIKEKVNMDKEGFELCSGKDVVPNCEENLHCKIYLKKKRKILCKFYVK